MGEGLTCGGRRGWEQSGVANNCTWFASCAGRSRAQHNLWKESPSALDQACVQERLNALPSRLALLRETFTASNRLTAPPDNLLGRSPASPFPFLIHVHSLPASCHLPGPSSISDCLPAPTVSHRGAQPPGSPPESCEGPRRCRVGSGLGRELGPAARCAGEPGRTFVPSFMMGRQILSFAG